MSANFLDNPFFRQFIGKIRPAYQIPARNDKFAKKLVPAEYQRMRLEVEQALGKSDFLAISSDGWKDIEKNKLINFVAFNPKPFLIETVDTDGQSLTGKYIFGYIIFLTKLTFFIKDLLSEQMEKVGSAKIVAVTTDNAKNMKAAWKLLEAKYPWIICFGCQSHSIDLAAKDICQKSGILAKTRIP